MLEAVRAFYEREHQPPVLREASGYLKRLTKNRYTRVWTPLGEHRLVVDDADDRIVGAHMIGPDAPEILQVLAVAVKARLRKSQLDECVAIHPTMAEELVLMK